MDDDFDDTVIRPARPFASDPSKLLDDTIIRDRSHGSERSARPVNGEPDASARASAAVAHAHGQASTSAYRFVVNTHEPIGLDRPAYIGRKPSSPRITTDARPRLVRVPSPSGEVSGTHVELRQQGLTVIVTDLKSTNGTQVIIPGRPPIRLRQGESVVVIPGSIVEIGDGNVIEILPVERAKPFIGTPRESSS